MANKLASPLACLISLLGLQLGISALAGEAKLTFREAHAADAPSAAPEQPALLERDGPREKDGTASAAPAEATEPAAIPDPAERFFHEGSFTHRDDQGRVLAKGEYREGKRTGKWTRWFLAGEAEPLSGAVDKDFQRPLSSEAQFVEGKLQGTWTLSDAKDRKIGQWQLQANRPNGMAIWWHPNGQKMREAQYRDGLLDGELTEWDADGKLLTSETYLAGRKLVTQVQWHKPGKKRLEGTSLATGQVNRSVCEWWTGTVKSEEVARYASEDKHGTWTWWYPDGNLQMQGNYKQGELSGKFTWWYPNQQKQIEGEYAAGIQNGAWVWYHPNGIREYKGEYLAGEQTGRWTRYNEDGQLLDMQIVGRPSSPTAAQDSGAKPRSAPDAAELPEALAPAQGARR